MALHTAQPRIPSNWMAWDLQVRRRLDSFSQASRISDSKALTHDTRLSLMNSLSSDPKNLGWSVRVLWCVRVRKIQEQCQYLVLMSRTQSTVHFQWHAPPSTHQFKSTSTRGDRVAHPRSTRTRNSDIRGEYTCRERPRFLS